MGKMFHYGIRLSRKNILTFIITLMVGAAFVFAFTTEDVSAATFNKSQKVTGVKIAAKSYNSVTVKWTKMKNAKGYQIYRAVSKNGKYKRIKTTSKTSYKNTGLSTGKTYYYKVRAYSKHGYSKYSAIVKGVPRLGTPKASATVNGTTATVKWKKVADAQGYQVYRATSENGKYKRIKTTSETSYKNTGLKDGNKYYYKVRAYRKVGKSTKYSAYSTVVRAKHICIISIDCETLAKDVSKLTDRGKKKYVPKDGWMIRSMKIEFSKGESVYDVLKKSCEKAGYEIEADYTSSYGSNYIVGINNLCEFDAGPLSGWMYSVNGVYPDYGCSSYKVNDGDKIRFRYTCDLGKDIGGSNSVQ